MLLRFFPRKIVGVVMGFVCAMALDCRAQAARDWKEHPAIVELEMHKETYALGDVHGDYDRLVELLAGAHLIAKPPAKPAEVEWIGGKAMLVCTGDFIDKSDHAMEVIALFRALQPSARRAGGEVVVTMGNHEARFLAGEKKPTEFTAELSAAGLSAAEVSAGTDKAGIGLWLRNLPIGAKAGDWFFCHGGNTGGRTVSQLQAELSAQITAKGFGAEILANPNSMLEARMHPRQWWDWDGSAAQLKETEKHGKAAKAGTGSGSEERLKKTVEALGCKHLVFGHQPGKITFADGTVREAGAIFGKFNGLVFLIDTGMSRGAASGHGAMLKIQEHSTHVTIETIDGAGKVGKL